MATAARLKDLWDTINLLWRARDNLLELWDASVFEKDELFSHRVIFRRVFIANCPDAVKHVMVTNVSNYKKSSYTERALSPLIGNGMFISHGELWKRQRRMATPAFHSRHVRRFSAEMTRISREMLERWTTQGDGRELEITREMARITAEVVCRTMFSEDLGGRASTVFDAFTKYQESLGGLDVAEAIGLGRWIPRWRTLKGRKAVAQLDAVLNAIIDKRAIEGGDSENDLLSILIRARDPESGQPMTANLVRDEVAVMILAGHETAANVLSWTWYLLSQSPRAEARLHEEVDRVLAGKEPDFGDIPSLVYTRAVLEESMRLYPPLHIFSREALADDVILGQTIPAGSMVLISPWCLHRHKKLWQNPEVFDPQRFLPENASGRSKYCYLPFGAGPRTCLGSGFAMTEIILIVSMVAQRYRLRLRSGHRVEPFGRLTLRPRFGLPMTIHER